jgi:hypothetical protein
MQKGAGRGRWAGSLPMRRPKRRLAQVGASLGFYRSQFDSLLPPRRRTLRHHRQTRGPGQAGDRELKTPACERKGVR